jgi:hypothetical protein
MKRSDPMIGLQRLICSSTHVFSLFIRAIFSALTSEGHCRHPSRDAIATLFRRNAMSEQNADKMEQRRTKVALPMLSPSSTMVPLY